MMTCNRLRHAPTFYPALVPGLALAAGLLISRSAWAQDAAIPLDGLELWVKADGPMTIVNNQISEWTDLSPKKNNAVHDAFGQGIPVLATANGKPTMRFNGGYTGFHFNQITTIRTVFAVLSKDSTSCLPTLPNYGTPAKFWIGGNANPTYFHPEHGCSIYNMNLSETSPNLVNGQTWVNGKLVDGRITAFPFTLGLLSLVSAGNVVADTIARDRNFQDRSWQGDISELIIYSKALDGPTRTAIQNSLALKYSLRIEGGPAIADGGSSEGGRSDGGSSDGGSSDGGSSDGGSSDGGSSDGGSSDGDADASTEDAQDLGSVGEDSSSTGAQDSGSGGAQDSGGAGAGEGGQAAADATVLEDSGTAGSGSPNGESAASGSSAGCSLVVARENYQDGGSALLAISLLLAVSRLRRSSCARRVAPCLLGPRGVASGGTVFRRRWATPMVRRLLRGERRLASSAAVSHNRVPPRSTGDEYLSPQAGLLASHSAWPRAVRAPLRAARCVRLRRQSGGFVQRRWYKSEFELRGCFELRGRFELRGWIQF